MRLELMEEFFNLAIEILDGGVALEVSYNNGWSTL